MNSFQHENPNYCYYFSSVFTTDSEHRNKHLGQGIEHDAHHSLSTRERESNYHHSAAEHTENC